MDTTGKPKYEELVIPKHEMATAILALLRARYTESLRGKVFRAYCSIREPVHWRTTTIYLGEPDDPLDFNPSLCVHVSEHITNKKMVITWIERTDLGDGTTSTQQTISGADSFYDSIEERVRAIAHHFRVTRKETHESTEVMPIKALRLVK